MDFDGFPEAVGLHTELSANEYFSGTFAANRPQPPVGVPVLPLPGALVDFDGDAFVTDTLDADCLSLNGNEMVVFTAESIVLDADEGDPSFGHAAQFLDHMVVAENITGGTNPRAQLRFYFAGGTINEAVPEEVGLRTLGVGSVAVVDRFQDSITVIDPGETNAGNTDGAWFVFVEDVSEDGERVTLTLGRALGATHSAIDDGMGSHDLEPGDPWYLKRFYVDGHEYNVVALMTRTSPGADPTEPATCNDRFAFITIRTPVPKGNYFNPQDSLFQQGYFLDGLPPEMSVMPPFNVDHTIVEDVERIEASEFADLNDFDACVGALAPAGPQVQRIVEEEPELRFGQELRETYRPAERAGVPAPRLEDGWETHQLAVTPGHYTEIGLPEGETYLLTLNWRSEVSRLAFYGCTRDEPGPFDDEEFPPQIGHDDVAAAAATWDPALIPAVNRFDPPLLDADANGIQDITPFFDARCSVTETVRVKLFYDPTEDDDLYVNKRPVTWLLPQVDLSIDKQVDSPTAVAGEVLGYLLTVTNHGPEEAPGVMIVDELPGDSSFEGSTGSCLSEGGMPETVRCDMGALPAGASADVTIFARVDAFASAGTQLSNVARVFVDGAIDMDPTNDVSIALATVMQVHDLRIDKRVSGPTHTAGTVLTYTLEVVNDGPSAATAVTVEDRLPPAVSFLGTDRPDSCSLVGLDLLRCVAGDLAPGASVTIDVGVDVPADVPPGTLLVNDASVGGDGVDPDPSDDEDSETVLVEAEADLSIAKAASPMPVRAGEQLTYTLTVTNTGPSDAPSVEVIDTLPAGVAYVGAVGAFCSGVSVGATGTLTCQLGTLSAGASISFHVVVDVDPAMPGGSSVLNSAVVSGPGSSDPRPGDNDDEVEVPVEAVADLGIEKTTVAEVLPGEGFDWRLTVSNVGPSTAIGVVVTDTLPVSTTFVSATGASCGGVAVGATGTLICDVGALAPGASVVIDVRLQVSDTAIDGQVLSNAAVVSSPVIDPDSGDDSVLDTTTVRRLADLSVSKDGLASAVAGERVTYTIRVDNAGPAGATDVVFTDTLPAGASLVTVPGGCVESPIRVVVCTLGDLAAGAFGTVSISVDLAPDLQDGVLLQNLVVVSTTADDPESGNDQALHDLVVSRQADLSVLLADDPDPVAAGGTLVYTATVSNGGPSNADDVVLAHMLPGDVSLIAASPACVEGPPGEITCDLGALAVGASDVLTASVTVDPSVVGGTVLVDSASVSAGTSDPNPGNDDDSEATTVEARVDLAITKAVDPTTVVAGEVLTYTFTVTNAGPSTAVATDLEDGLPTVLSLLAATPGCVEAPAGTLGCALGDLAPGATVELTATARLSASAVPQSSVVNTATVSSTGIELDPLDNRDTAAFLVDAVADLRLDKVAPAQVLPGAELVYQIEVANDGPSDATGVSVVDVLPAGTTYGAASGGTCVEAPVGEITCDLGGLSAGAQAQLTISVTVSAGLPEDTVLQNTATVSAATTDPDGGNDSDTTQTTVRLADEADLSIQKTADESAPGVGETFSYSLLVQNGGPRAAPDVVLTDTLPAGLSFVDGPCTELVPGVLRCALGDLASGASTTLPLTVAVDAGVPAGAVRVNTATVASGLPDPQPADNVDTATVTITARADLVLDKRASPSPIAAGDVLTYSLTVTNTGPSAATGIGLTDTLPSGVGYLSDDGGCDVSALPTVVCDLGELASGASATVEIVVRVAAALVGGELLNTARATSAVVDPNPEDNEASTSTPVFVAADVAIRKAASPEPVVAGEHVTYTLVVSNIGPSTATGVVLSDTLPSGIEYVSDDAGCDGGAPPMVACSLGTIAAGDSITVTLLGSVDPSLAGGQQRSNVVIVDAISPDPEPANDEAQVTSNLLNEPGLSLTKTGEGEVVRAGSPPTIAIVDSEVTAGQRLTYTLTTANQGPSTGLGLRLVDVLPAGATYVSDTGGCAEAPAGTLTCDLGDVLPGSLVEFEVVVDMAPDIQAGTIATNVAAVAPETAFGNSPQGLAANGGVEATHDTLVGVVADLRLSKMASSGAIAVGETVTFTLVVTNTGPSLARGVLVSDTLPAGSSYVSDDAGCAADTLQGLSCDLGDLPVGASTSFEVVVTGMAGFEGIPLVNRARVLLTGGGMDPDDSNDHAEAHFEVLPVADLVVAKAGTGARVLEGPVRTVRPDAVTAGEALSYTLVVTNTGPSTATSVVVTDTLPEGVTLVAAPAGCDTGSLPQLPCALPDLAPGAATILSIRVDVAPEAEPGSFLPNQAYVTAAAHEPTPGDNSAGQATEIFAAADLALSKSASPGEVLGGDLVTFTLTVMNSGPSLARSVRLTDTLPISVSAVSLPSGCSEGPSGVIGCDIGDLEPAASAVVSFTARVGHGLDGTVVVNAARVAPDAPTLDPDTSNNDDQASIFVPRRVDLRLSKVGAGEVVLSGGGGSTAILPNLVTAGRRVTFTLRVVNDGPSDATEVVLTDTLPSGMTFLAVDHGGCTIGGPRDLECALGTLVAGSSVTVLALAEVAGTVADGSTLRNVARVDSDELDLNPADNVAHQETEVEALADLLLEKTASSTYVQRGERLTYTLRVENLGPSLATTVVLTDLLPSRVSLEIAPPDCDLSGLPLLSCPIEDLAPGDVATRTLVVSADALPDVALSALGVQGAYASLDRSPGYAAAAAARPAAVSMAMSPTWPAHWLPPAV